MAEARVELTDDEERLLARLARERGLSRTELLHEALALLGRATPPPAPVVDDEVRRRAVSVVGRFRSAEGGSVRSHDEWLMQAMAADPKRELHELIERLTDEEARRLTAALRESDGAPAVSRPLTVDDIVLVEPILPDDETADEMIATIRRWHREGGPA